VQAVPKVQLINSPFLVRGARVEWSERQAVLPLCSAEVELNKPRSVPTLVRTGKEGKSYNL
jgi:hypothetical protein